MATAKTPVFSTEDKYRKQQMVAWLQSRGMLDAATAAFILRGIR